MNKNDAEELTQSLGQVVGGSWRMISQYKKMGVPEALGLSTESWVNDRLGGYVKMTVEDRRKAVEELTADGESQREAAKILGVDASTVNRDLKPVANATPEEQETAENSQPPVANATPINAVAALAHIETDKPTHVANNSGNNEWYTPDYIIDAARNAMNGIELDPASSDIANSSVGADRFYTDDIDGLKQDWIAKSVWMNPPYSSKLIGPFTEAFCRKFSVGEFQEGCVLVNNATETAWFQRMLKLCSCICLLAGRTKFVDTDGDASGAPLQGQAVLYFGEFPHTFKESFNNLGVCLNRG